jgi:hypothetical protein
MNYGFSGLNQNLNSNKNNNFTTNTALGLSNLIIAARVLSIVLDESHPRFKELGGWNGLGTIEYEPVSTPFPRPLVENFVFPTATTLNPNVKNYPLINEIVYLISLPNTDIGETTVSTNSYYINITSLWNHPHHNAYPATPNNLPPSQQKDYIQTQAGSVRRVTDQSTEIFLGKTFKERSNIHPLLPFEGDVIHEGRWGNSIRLGSTNILSSNTDIPKNESLNITHNFNPNNTSIPQSIISELNLINNKINLFKGNYQNVTVSTVVTCGETFNDTLFLGNLLTLLDKNYTSINKQIRTNVEVGKQYFISINITLNGTQSVNTENKSLNNWSSAGTSGDPIVIIRNGQGAQTPEGWIPITEDTFTDNSSIYLTSTQNVPILASSISYISYPDGQQPTSPKKYAGSQIILDSGRLVFNAYKDHLLLSSAKSINLNSQESVNIDTKKFITQADKIFLGKEDLAKEPLLLGDTTVNLLKDLIYAIKEAILPLQSLTSQPVPVNGTATFPQLLKPITNALTCLESLEKQLGYTPETCTITSKRNFTL